MKTPNLGNSALVIGAALLLAGTACTSEENRDLQAGAQSAMEAEAHSISIQEWLVPWEGRPRDPYVAPDGKIWFVGQRTHYVGLFDPETAEFDRFDLDDGAGPHTVVVDAEGTPWYAGNRLRHIGKLDPVTGEITRYEMEEEILRDPHTMDFDRDGNIWFTAQGGNGIGKLDVSSGAVTSFVVPTERARPYGIVMDPERVRPWIVLFGTNKLATVDPRTMELEEIVLPREETRPRRLAVTSDGMVWYGDYAAGMLGRYNPDSGEIHEWPMPQGEGAQPYAMAADHRNRVWLVSTGTDPNYFVAFDPATEEFVLSEPVESGGGTVRHMVFHEPTHTIWFGTDTNYIGRAEVR